VRPRIFLIVALGLLIMGLPIFTRASHSSEAPTASFAYSPSIPAPGDIIVFNASASYAPNGWIVQYAWDFSDGSITTTTDPIATHSYPIDGDYTVELTVTDNSGSTGVAVAVVQVRTVVFFRVCIGGSITPFANVQVTAYYNNGTAWVTAPASCNGIQIKYDKMTQPDLANNDAQRNRNPGYTASILRQNASNIGFDAHTLKWTVFFKFEWGSNVAYWPNNTDTVYTYSNEHGVQTYHYDYGHQAYWDNNAGTYVIKVGDIPGNGVSASENHPIIVGILCPPPAQQWGLTVNTDPSGIATIPGQDLYANGTNVVLTAPTYVNVSSSTRYSFNYWDVEGTSRGSGVNPITVLMTANHTATAHYITQYFLTVSSAYDSPAPISGWFNSGTGITASVTSPVSGPSGTQFVCTGWTGTGSVPASGTSTSTSFTITQASSITWNWKTRYYLTVSSVYGTPGGQGWYDNGSTAYATVTPLTVAGPSGTRYVFTVWSGDASGNTSPSDAITMNGPKTATANWKTQYYLAVSSARDSPAPISGWFDSGAGVNASVTSPSPGSSGTQYVCTGWTGTGSVPGSGSSTTVNFTITQPSSITWNWKTQYQVIFDQTGVGSDFTGTIVTIGGVNYNTSGLPTTPQFWWDQGSNHSFSFASPLPVNGGQNYVWNSTSGLSSLQSETLTITTSGSVTGNYIVQNRITFDQNGVGSDFTGTVVIIDEVNYNRSQLPVSFPWANGSLHTFAYQSPLIPNANTKYVWTSTTGLTNLQSGSITVTTYGSIVGNYETQYYLTVSSAYGTVGGQGWYDSGSTAYATVSPLTVAGPSGTRYVFIQWSGDASGSTSPSNAIVMNGPKAAAANWTTQYYLTVTSAYDSPAPISGWFDSGAGVNASVASPSPGSSGTQYVCTGWTGTGSVPGSGSSTTVNFTITQPSSITWNWKTQYYLTVTSAYGTVGGQGWYDSGSTAYATVSPLTVGGPSGTQYVFTVWSGDASGNTSPSNAIVMSGPKTANANWKTQHYLTLVTSPSGVDSPSGAGWYDSGASATISTDAFVDIVSGSSRYRFNGWTTDYMPEIEDPTRSPTTVTIDQAKTVTVNYAVQYNITFNQSGASPGFTGTIAIIDSINYNASGLRVSFWWDNSSSHNFAFQSPLIVTANNKQYVWTSTTGLSVLQSGTMPVSSSGSVIGNYKTQYYLTVTSPYDSPTPTSGWFDSGALVTASVTSPASGPAGTRYICTGWTGTGSVPASGSSTTASFTMTQASSITWNWKTQYLLTVLTDPSGLSPQPARNPTGDTGPTNGWWYDSSTNVALTAQNVTGYNFYYWDIDGTSQGTGTNPITATMNAPHTATAHYTLQAANLTVTISPLSATIYIGESVPFTSIIGGGTAPYNYQWYLNGNPVSGTTSSTWTFTPTAPGIYYVYLKVTDAKNNTATSDTARVVVLSVPVGGYSVSLTGRAPTIHIAAYFALVALFGAMLSLKKRKRK